MSIVLQLDVADRVYSSKLWRDRCREHFTFDFFEMDGWPRGTLAVNNEFVTVNHFWNW